MAVVEHFPNLVSSLTEEAVDLDLFARLRLAREGISGRAVFTTSFGLEDQAITHAILSQGLDIDITTIDTGRLFSETHDVWAATERRYGYRIKAAFPEQADVETLVAEQGTNGFRESIDARQACCHVRKVVPLNRLLKGAGLWITGLRADQSIHRSGALFANEDLNGRIKVNPLYDWSREEVVAFTQKHAIPTNALHERNYLSIGCAPCTRAIRSGEPERAGRWWWESEGKTECGLHANPLHLSSRSTTP
ncbi:MAG: phosphoadenylyl-sulfate reductase [Bradyrhizobiaceae bacterium]|nr:MAG: phosphoadenylyl-sulfate reductase [Bradyrhizobiaceae bacterium]